MPSRPPRFRPHRAASTTPTPQRQFDQRRGTAASRGYTHRWSKAAEGHRRNHPLCLGCEAMGRVEPAVLVDHVEPHRGDTAKFWDRSRWQSSCRWHHDVVKQRLEQMFDAGAIGVEDLRLDSAVAVKLAFELEGRDPLAGRGWGGGAF